MPAKAKRKQPRAAKWLSPGLVALAVALFWSALHEPPVLAPPSVAVWLLSTLAICLLCRAALALAAPALGLALLAVVRLKVPGEQEGK